MRCPILAELPSSPTGKIGWPWTESSLQLPEKMPGGPHWPLVSIVTPSYNQGEFIEETIRSVLLQGYPNLEYMVIDGVSTDGSVDIIRKYQERLAYWVSEPDKGQSDAINKGWSRATGEILAWLNSDDLYEPGALYAAVTYLSKNPEAGAVYGDSLYVDETGNPIGMFPTQRFDYLEMLGQGFIPQPSAFVRRSVLDQTGLLDPDLQSVMDYDLWMRVGLKAKVAYLPVTLSRFRVQPMMKGLTIRRRKAQELVLIHERLFTRDDLPEDISNQRRKIMGRAHLFAAQLLLWDRRPLPFVQQMVRSLWLFPTNADWYRVAAHLPIDVIGFLSRAAAKALLEPFRSKTNSHQLA